MRRNLFFKIIFVLMLTIIMCGALTACGKVEFKVNFVVDGEVYATIDTNGKEVIKMPDNPEKDDYTFDGWYWDEGSWQRPFTANSLLDAPLSSSMSVYAKWTINKSDTETGVNFIITYDTNGGVIGNQTITVKLGSQYELDIPTRIGYTFDGWYEDKDCNNRFVPSSVNNNITIFAKWTPCTDTIYTIKYYYENLNGVYETDTKEDIIMHGTTLSNVSASPIEVIGFDYCAERSSDSGVIAADGSMVLSLYYKRKNCVVTFNVTEGEYISGDLQQNVKWGATAIAPIYLHSGYTLSWDKPVSNITEDQIITGVWVPGTHTQYIVEYYYQNVNDNGYSKQSDKTEVLFGVTDSNVDIVPKNINGFTHNMAIGTMSGTIRNDGSSIFSLYYDRNIYTVKFVSSIGSFVSGELEQSIRFEGDANAPKYNLDGYELSWDSTLNNITSSKTVNAIWTAKTDTPYLVKYYKQNLNDDDYTIDNNETVMAQGVTDSRAEANIKEFEGFSYTENNSIVSGNIAGDGSLVLEVYYSRNQYEVRFHGNNGILVTGTETQTLKYGSSIQTPVYTKTNYSFDGWYKEATSNTPYIINTVPAYSLDIYAGWIDYAVVWDYNTTKLAISIYDTISPQLFDATANDTDGNALSVVAQLQGAQTEGSTVSIKLSTTDIYGVTINKIINNVKVYGLPTIHYDTITAIKASDDLSAVLFGLNGVDTYGAATATDVEITNGDKTSGQIISVSLKVIDIAGNVTSCVIDNIRVMGLPTISYNRDIKAIKFSDGLEPSSFKATAKNSFNETLSVVCSIATGTYGIGNVFSANLYAVDEAGNEMIITTNGIKVYGTPVIIIKGATEYDDESTITINTLNASAVDSFGVAIDELQLELFGEMIGGQTVTAKITAIDVVGNVGELVCSTIKIFGTPVVSYNTDITAIKAESIINADLIEAVATDSHGEPIAAIVTVSQGKMIGGTTIAFNISAVDKFGNTNSMITMPIEVHDVNLLSLNYNASLTTIIKKSSFGEEFNALAYDSFGNAIATYIQIVDGVLEGGNAVTIKLVAKDAADNFIESEEIANLKVYDLPTITYLPILNGYIHADTNIEADLNATAADSYGKTLSVTHSNISNLTIGDEIEYKLSTIDIAGNKQEITLMLQVIAKPTITLDADGGIVNNNSVEVSYNKSYSLPIPTKTGYVFMGWKDGNDIYYTDRMANSLFSYNSISDNSFYAIWYYGLNSENTDLSVLDNTGNYILTKDVTISKTWSNFGGIFDGDGHSVTGLSCLTSVNNGTIKNVKINGSICLTNNGLILYCKVIVSKGVTYSVDNGTRKKPTTYTGTICAKNEGTILGCYAEGSIAALISTSSSTGVYVDNSIAYTGGLVGWNVGIVTDCYSQVSMSVSEGTSIEGRTARIGALVGNGQAAVNSKFYGSCSIRVFDSDYAGQNNISFYENGASYSSFGVSSAAGSYSHSKSYMFDSISINDEIPCIINSCFYQYNSCYDLIQNNTHCWKIQDDSIALYWE